jgi:hypothetical protein
VPWWRRAAPPHEAAFTGLCTLACCGVCCVCCGCCARWRAVVYAVCVAVGVSTTSLRRLPLWGEPARGSSCATVCVCARARVWAARPWRLQNKVAHHSRLVTSVDLAIFLGGSQKARCCVPSMPRPLLPPPPPLRCCARVFFRSSDKSARRGTACDRAAVCVVCVGPALWPRCPVCVCVCVYVPGPEKREGGCGENVRPAVRRRLYAEVPTRHGAHHNTLIPAEGVVRAL